MTTTPIYSRLSDIERRELKWLCPGRMPLGKVGISAGDPGVGKSVQSLDDAARVSSGTPWHNCTAENPAGDVILMSAEDDPADTIRPRLEAAGADLNRVYFLDGAKDELGTERAIALDRDLDALEALLQKLANPRLIIVDPITAYLDATDTNSNAQVRSVMRCLQALAQSYGPTIQLISHLNKRRDKETGSAMYRVTGSLAFVAAARSAWYFGIDPHEENRRLMVPLKMNLIKDPRPLAYYIMDDNGQPVVVWDNEEVHWNADALMTVVDRERHGVSETTRAKTFLKTTLQAAGGRMPGKEIKDRAEAAGFSPRTIQRAVSILGIECRRVRGSDGTLKDSDWVLPQDEAHVKTGEQANRAGDIKNPIRLLAKSQEGGAA